jgi:hypothetical protein
MQIEFKLATHLVRKFDERNATLIIHKFHEPYVRHKRRVLSCTH